MPLVNIKINSLDLAQVNNALRTLNRQISGASKLSEEDIAALAQRVLANEQKLIDSEFAQGGGGGGVGNITIIDPNPSGATAVGPQGGIGPQGEQGPVGIQGPPAPSSPATRIEVPALAGEAVSAADVLYQETDKRVFKADNTVLAHADKLLGVALQSTPLGSFVDVLLFGPIVDSNFSFTLGTVLFLNGVGTLSTTAPTSGFSILMGKQSDAQTFFLDKEDPLILI